MADDASSPLPGRDPDDFSVVLYFSPEMVVELAMGVDPPYEIAERYGLTDLDYATLSVLPWFEELVARKRVELHDGGLLFTAKAGMMAEALLTRLFQQSMVGAIAPPLTVEVAKQLTDIGRLKPQPLNTQPAAGTGSGFQINIQVNGADVVRHDAHVVDIPRTPRPPTSAIPGTAPQPDIPPTVTAGSSVVAGEPQPPATMSLAFKAPKGVPPASISGLKVPDFDTRPSPRLGVGLPSQASPNQRLPPSGGRPLA